MEYLKSQLQRTLIRSVRNSIRQFFKTLALVLVGVSLVSIGMIFIWLGVYEYLTQFLAKWLAWLIVGVISILLGIVLALSAMSRR